MMKMQMLVTFALVGLLSACGKEPAPPATDATAKPAEETQNIVEKTGDDVQKAVEAGKEAVDTAVKDAEGGAPKP